VSVGNRSAGRKKNQEAEATAQILDEAESNPSGLQPVDAEPAIAAPVAIDEDLGDREALDGSAPGGEEKTDNEPETSPSPQANGEELALARAECADLREQLLRRKAEFDNYRRRVERDRQAAADDARADAIREFLPALDNLERALRSEGGEGSVRQGIEMIYSELEKALARLGVTSHEPVGERFDPLSQQALLYEEVPGFADGTVVEVYRRSYHVNDRLLRPAMVKVAKGAEQDDRESDEETTH